MEKLVELKFAIHTWVEEEVLVLGKKPFLRGKIWLAIYPVPISLDQKFIPTDDCLPMVIPCDLFMNKPYVFKITPKVTKIFGPMKIGSILMVDTDERIFASSSIEGPLILSNRCSWAISSMVVDLS